MTVVKQGARVRVGGDDVEQRRAAVVAAFYRHGCRRSHGERRKGQALPELVFVFDTPRQANEFAVEASGWLK